MPRHDTQPPKRKEPGVIGKSLAWCIQLLVWLIISLCISYVIEWTGMAFFWKEEGERHSEAVLKKDIVYLNQHLHDNSIKLKNDIAQYALQAKDSISKTTWLNHFKSNRSRTTNSSVAKAYEWINQQRKTLEPQINASVSVMQIFIIRLALIIFSLPIFFIAALMGAVDGLVERDLRRWGGGRESSNVFNLARRSIAPTFIAVCVIYISVPISLSPAIIILPFAVLLGLSVRVTFERLKKYF